MFSRDHLIIGALGFVLGGVVATASITAVLLTQQKEEKVCPPISAIIAPQASTHLAVGEETSPAKPVENVPAPIIDSQKIKGVTGEEADRLSEDQQQLLQRKQLLESQLKDSNEILRLKEQQIKDMEAKLKQ